MKVASAVRGALRRLLRHVATWGRRPAVVVVVSYAVAIGVGTMVLTLPVATEQPTPTDVTTALFTAASAVCVTGLTVVDTPQYWSTFGEIIIMALIQLGGLGIMTAASLLTIAVARRVGLRMQLNTQAETRTLSLADVRGVAVGVVMISMALEATVALIFAGRLFLSYGQSMGEATYLGVFHAISAFNNAGFSLYSDNLMHFAGDPWITVPVLVAVVCGGIGFPVLFEVGRRLRGLQWRRHRSPRRPGARHRWTLHTRVTVLTYGALLIVGATTITAIEWDNPDTLRPLSLGERLLAGAFHGITPRTSGFNTLDVGDMESSTLLITNVLMFIGGGSAGTAGGIKVTTFAVLAFVILAEIRGAPTVHALGRRLSVSVTRQAVTVALLGVGIVIGTSITLLTITPFNLDQVLFEAVSAFGTVGLSTGITSDLPTSGQLLITLVMFIGWLGPITLASSLALRHRTRRYELPKERPIVG